MASSVASPAAVPGVIETVMLLPSGPALAARKPIAGEGGRTGGGARSPDAACAFASASSVAVSPLSNTDVQADASATVEPLNSKADSGTNRCAPVESVNVTGRLPVTSSAIGDPPRWSAWRCSPAPHHTGVTRASQMRSRACGRMLALVDEQRALERDDDDAVLVVALRED